eukprot:superscaffoldBa00002333_g13948
MDGTEVSMIFSAVLITQFSSAQVEYRGYGIFNGAGWMALADLRATMSLDLKATFHALNIAHTTVVIQDFWLVWVVMILVTQTSSMHLLMYPDTDSVIVSGCLPEHGPVSAFKAVLE